MKVCGIIVEYNPFHNGHIYHINKAKEISDCDLLIAIMSPTFMQRGEPAIIDKFSRTEFALDYGVDLVIELPSIYAIQSANHFADGALKILNELDIDTLVFGSETNNIKELSNAATISLSQEYQNKVKNYLKDGQRYATACNLAFKDYNINIINQANDILGLAYIQSIINNNYKIKPISIKRTNDYLSSDINNPIASATAIRQAQFQQDNIGHTTPMNQVLQNNNNVYLDDLFYNLKYLLTILNISQLKEIQGFDEGLEYLFINNIHKASNINEFIDLVTSKRYPKTRIQRAIVYLICNITKQDIKSIEVDYIRVLGMNKKGQNYLKNHLKTSYKVITSFAQHNSKALDFELKISRVYAQLKNEALAQREYQQPVIIKHQE